MNQKWTSTLQPFTKGTSGNPSGLPKATRLCRRLAQEMVPEAMLRLGRLMRQDDDMAISLAATREILMRGCGKYLEASSLRKGQLADAGKLPANLSDLTDEQLQKIMAIVREGLA